MSVDTVVMIVETFLLAVTVVFVIALLRSHAEILRRLVAIDDGVRTAGPAGAFGQREDRAAGGAVTDIVGENLAGDAVKFALGAGSPRTLLAFLSSGCAACARACSTAMSALTNRDAALWRSDTALDNATSAERSRSNACRSGTSAGSGSPA